MGCVWRGETEGYRQNVCEGERETETETQSVCEGERDRENVCVGARACVCLCVFMCV